jgi:hypothetical protein
MARKKQLQLADPKQTPNKPQRKGGRNKQSATPAATTVTKPKAVSEQAKLIKDEVKLIERYPNRKFKPGSLMASGAVPEFGKKRTIVILCEACGAERRVATSDIFHCSKCVSCTKKAKSPKKAEKSPKAKAEAPAI